MYFKKLYSNLIFKKKSKIKFVAEHTMLVGKIKHYVGNVSN